jgi:hypothetical protein
MSDGGTAIRDPRKPNVGPIPTASAPPKAP